MKILFDFQTFTMQTFGGISRLFFEVADKLGDNKDFTTEIASEYSFNYYLRHSNKFASQFEKDFKVKDIANFLPGINFKGKGRIFNMIYKKNMGLYDHNKKFAIETLKKGNFDVFQPTYYDPYFLDYLNGKPFVLGVYDMTHEIYPEYFANLGEDIIKNKRILIQEAKKIFAISKKTKNDILDFYDIDPKKIDVIYLGNSIDSKNKNDNLDLPTEYLLYVGNREIYKNFYFFINVFAKLKRTHNNLSLVCSGGGNFTPQERLLFKSFGVEESITYVSASDENLATLYSKAYCYVSPSLYEGFGIPIAEAFSMGCPIVLSNASCYPEIAGESALYFNPKDFNDCYRTLNEFLNNRKLRDELAKKSQEKSNQYTWNKTVKGFEKIYRSLSDNLS